MSGTIYYCPLAPECGWTYAVAEPPNVSEHHLENIFGRGIVKAAALHDMRVKTERALEEHMKSHKMIEYIEKIQALKKELGRMP
jgi:hypothetical protein